MAPTPKMCSVSAALSKLPYLSQQPADQVINDHGSKSVAEGLISLVNMGDIVASHRTENTEVGEHWVEQFCDIGIGNIRLNSNVPVEVVKANKARDTSNLPSGQPLETQNREGGSQTRMIRLS